MPEVGASPILSAILAQGRAAIDAVCDAGGSVRGEALAGAVSLLEDARAQAAAFGEVARDLDYRLMGTALIPGIQALVAEVAAEADADAIMDVVGGLLSRTARG